MIDTDMTPYYCVGGRCAVEINAKRLANIPGNEAFQPLALSRCRLVKKLTRSVVPGSLARPE